MKTRKAKFSGLSVSRQLYLMTNMMNGHALTSEEALEVWMEVSRLKSALRCYKMGQPRRKGAKR